MFFHWLSLSNALILDLDDSYNTRFNADICFVMEIAGDGHC